MGLPRLTSERVCSFVRRICTANCKNRKENALAHCLSPSSPRQGIADHRMHRAAKLVSGRPTAEDEVQSWEEQLSSGCLGLGENPCTARKQSTLVGYLTCYGIRSLRLQNKKSKKRFVDRLNNQLGVLRSCSTNACFSFFLSGYDTPDPRPIWGVICFS